MKVGTDMGASEPNWPNEADEVVTRDGNSGFVYFQFIYIVIYYSEYNNYKLLLCLS